MSEQENKTRAAFQGLTPDQVQSVSAGGVSVTLRDPAQSAQALRAKWELELEKRRAEYNPLFYGAWYDKNQRK